METEGIDELRAVVAWCNGQNENLWLPPPPYKAPSVANILAAYRLTNGAHILSWLEDDCPPKQAQRLARLLGRGSF